MSLRNAGSLDESSFQISTYLPEAILLDRGGYPDLQVGLTGASICESLVNMNVIMIEYDVLTKSKFYTELPSADKFSDE